jgi:hypothetical protein
VQIIFYITPAQVHITFNKEVIKGSPFEVNIVEPPILGPDGSPMFVQDAL